MTSPSMSSSTAKRVAPKAAAPKKASSKSHSAPKTREAKDLDGVVPGVVEDIDPGTPETNRPHKTGLAPGSPSSMESASQHTAVIKEVVAEGAEEPQRGTTIEPQANGKPKQNSKANFRISARSSRKLDAEAHPRKKALANFLNSAKFDAAMGFVIFSCLAAEMITKPYAESDDPVMAEMVEMYFSDILPTMLTFVQFVTVDSVGAIYAPMILRDPTLLVLFLPFMLIVSVALMNLVTAVIVEGAIAQAGQDKEAQIAWKKQQVNELLPRLKELFHELDEDGSGSLTIEEFLHCDEDLKESVMQYLDIEDFGDLFKLLDRDHSGEVDIDEFCESISKITRNEAPLELTRIIRQVDDLKQQNRQMVDRFSDRMDTLAQNQKRMETEFGRSLARLEKALLSKR
eukprot:TRINITY_DN5965_c0_g1_i2.p1 TRINITY_DN5965_c0_g1~~TRINITY_DN5965_c0_g1_i2.p1  ORF type:complete len:401 (+),score=88.54 TRINITY_DN5965_c0_g1_i2:224-1426(+)